MYYKLWYLVLKATWGYCNISGIRITLVISILIMKDYNPIFAYHPLSFVDPRCCSGSFFFYFCNKSIHHCTQRWNEQDLKILHTASFRVGRRDCGLYSTLSKTRSQRKTTIMLIAHWSRKMSSEKTGSSGTYPGSRRPINATGNIYIIRIFLLNLILTLMTFLIK